MGASKSGVEDDVVEEGFLERRSRKRCVLAGVVMGRELDWDTRRSAPRRVVRWTVQDGTHVRTRAPVMCSGWR